jgi:hypothetical protein
MSAASPESELLAQIESGQASRQVFEFAARGMLPLPPGELVRAVAVVLTSHDGALVSIAKETFAGFVSEDLKEAVLTPGVRSMQLDTIARNTTDASVLEPLIRHKAVADETLAWLAERIEPHLQDVLVTNQIRLIAAPVIVERLFENPRLSTDIRRRADEFLEEFFLKKEREIHGEVPEAEPEAPEPDPEAPKEEEPVLSEEEKKSLFARLSTMPVLHRIRLAYRGNKEERLYLVRDTNRLVTAAVLKSPKTREADAEIIANMKSVSEDVLRSIGLRKQWLRKYGILAALVKNPRSPIDVTLPLVMRLTHRDQKVLAGDRNVPDAIRASARREVARREH